MKSNFTSIMLSGAAVAAMLLLAGCAKENGLNQWMNRNEGCTELELTDVNSGEMLSKAAIDGTGFPRDGRIGLFFFKDEAGAELYGDGACSNVEYSYNQDKSKWTANPAIRVGSTPGYLYGYYPYNGADKDVKAIAVESSLDGDDAMYVAKQDPVTDQTAGNVAITMRHALARVSITVKNKGYSGAAKLSRIEFVGAKTAPSGTLNALDGSITATKSDVTLEVPETNQDITAAGTRYECLLVPSEVDASAQNVTLRLTIDGQQKTVSLTGENALKIVSGVKARLTIDLSDSGLSIVDGIQVDDWQTVTVGGHTVTVKLSDDAGIVKDVMVTAYNDNENVIVKAQAESGRSIECVLSDDKLCDFTKNNNIYTFTISDITSDLTATVGYTIAHSVSLNKDALNLIKDYGHYRLVATVLPEEAEDKTLIWSSSDESVATIDQNGYVKALTTGSATITAETKVGGHTATCTVTVVEPQSRPDGTLPGHFSVSDNTVVYFSKGNLYCSGATFKDDGTVLSMDNATWGFETHQYDTTPSENGDRNLNHISHFMWCSSAEKAMALRYDYDTEWYRQSAFFAEKDFSVGGVNAWSTPTMDEWSYLLNTRTMKYNVPRYTNKTSGITIGGISYFGLFIYPDDYDGMVVGDASETWTWENINDAGIVFLPAAGYRDGYIGNANVHNVGYNGYYWSASPFSGISAYDLDFFSGNVNPSNRLNHDQAYSVRLVTESK